MAEWLRQQSSKLNIQVRFLLPAPIRVRSSTDQSTGLRSRGLHVRIVPDAPQKQRKRKPIGDGTGLENRASSKGPWAFDSTPLPPNTKHQMACNSMDQSTWLLTRELWVRVPPRQPINPNAALAQSGEQLIVDQKVRGSNPLRGANFTKHLKLIR